ncbi:MAG: TatD family hydrolase [Fusobacteriaceae bacterium]|jgi:TatD DNase family protein|nr:TatD family hydrolase [Fusobacteriaceae bacterium]
MGGLTDTHVHLDMREFRRDRTEVLERIKENMDFVVNIGCDVKSSRESVRLAEKYPFVYAAVGIHPSDITGFCYEWEVELEKLCAHPKVVALGEIGLDYHWMTEPAEVQREVFAELLSLAEKVKKPVVIHTREAMEDTLRVLSDYPETRGIMHCYPGSVAEIPRLKNFTFGIGGVLTFPNSKNLREVVEKTPIDRLVLETDCPFLTPAPFRGKRNEPLYTEYVAREIARIKEMDYEDVVRITNENARAVYGIKG